MPAELGGMPSELGLGGGAGELGNGLESDIGKAPAKKGGDPASELGLGGGKAPAKGGDTLSDELGLGGDPAGELGIPSGPSAEEQEALDKMKAAKLES